MSRKIKSRRGSAMVEAAVIIPLLFLIIALIISVTLRTNRNVGDLCAGYEEETAKLADTDPMISEAVLRIRWLRDRN